MTDLALDPSETRPSVVKAPHRAPRRRIGRIALLSLVGLTVTGAFAGVVNTVFSGLAGPQRAPIAVRRNAADWPDLKDGLPALADVPAASTPVVHEAAIRPLRDKPIPSGTGLPKVSEPSPMPTAALAEKPATAAARPLLAIVAVPVIGPPRQAGTVAPTRTVATLAPSSAETIRARTAGPAFALLPSETAELGTVEPTSARADAVRPDAKAEPAKSEPTKIESTKAEQARGRSRTEARLRATAEKVVAPRRAASVEAQATPIEAAAAEEDTEVFGLKVPSLAPAGRKIRESVEALGDAVKGFATP